MNQRNGPASSESAPISTPAPAIQVSCGFVHQDGASCCGKWCIATSECSVGGTGKDMKLLHDSREGVVGGEDDTFISFHSQLFHRKAGERSIMHPDKSTK